MSSDQQAKQSVPGAQVTKQLPLIEAQTAWFHVFKSMVDSGDVAKMGPFAVTVYLVIKAYTNWKTGKSWPGTELIAEKTGISERKVRDCLKILEEHGHLTRELKGRKYVYRLREKVQVVETDGEDQRPIAEATWDYLPSTVKAAVAELKNFVVTGKEDGLTVIHIEHLTMNLQQNFDNARGTQGNYNATLAGAIDWTKVPDSDPVKKAFLAAQKGPGNTGT